MSYFHFLAVPVAWYSSNADLLVVLSCSPSSPSNPCTSITLQFYCLAIAFIELCELVIYDKRVELKVALNPILLLNYFLSWRMTLVQDGNRCNCWSNQSFPYASSTSNLGHQLFLTIFAKFLKALKVVLKCEFNKCCSNQVKKEF